ncbi:segregation/condensation protein A [Alicyclobacillus curvatus]|nr:segregation/condensation protein A [Alicyclobacillus curvatus]
MSYEITLEKFSGPLDLLLHLIRKQEIDIHDIPIALITEQFLSYLRAMEELSLEIASEFLVMAATLLAIKSRMLLPRKAAEVSEDGAENIDPRDELVLQLLEYQRCKWAAVELKSREHLQSLVYTRPPMDMRPFHSSEPQPLEGVSLWDMVDAYRKLLVRIPKEDRVAEIKGREISVEDTMSAILTQLRRFSRATFTELLGTMRTRSDLVASFLALLELVKIGAIQCYQKSPFHDIEVTLKEEYA